MAVVCRTKRTSKPIKCMMYDHTMMWGQSVDELTRPVALNSRDCGACLVHVVHYIWSQFYDVMITMRRRRPEQSFDVAANNALFVGRSTNSLAMDWRQNYGITLSDELRIRWQQLLSWRVWWCHHGVGRLGRVMSSTEQQWRHAERRLTELTWRAIIAVSITSS